MITAVDTTILIDVIRSDEHALNALSMASAKGHLVIGEIVYAEMCAGMSLKDMEHFCRDFNIELITSSPKALSLAGQIWLRYKQNSASSKVRVLADFMVAAHAVMHADQLLTCDRGFYRNYFKELKIITPEG